MGRATRSLKFYLMATLILEWFLMWDMLLCLYIYSAFFSSARTNTEVGGRSDTIAMEDHSKCWFARGTWSCSFPLNARSNHIEWIELQMLLSFIHANRHLLFAVS